jgi:hypothetical protein
MSTVDASDAAQNAAAVADDASVFVAVRTVRAEPTRLVDVMTLLRTVKSLMADSYPIELVERIGVGTPTVAVVHHTRSLADLEGLMAVLEFADEIPMTWIPRGLRRNPRAQLRDALRTIAGLTVDVDDSIGRVLRRPRLSGSGARYASLVMARPDPPHWGDATRLACNAAVDIERRTELGAGVVRTIANGERRLALLIVGASLAEVVGEENATSELSALATVETTLWRWDNSKPDAHR